MKCWFLLSHTTEVLPYFLSRLSLLVSGLVSMKIRRIVQAWQVDPSTTESLVQGLIIRSLSSAGGYSGRSGCSAGGQDEEQ